LRVLSVGVAKLMRGTFEILRIIPLRVLIISEPFGLILKLLLAEQSRSKDLFDLPFIITIDFNRGQGVRDLSRYWVIGVLP